VFRTLGCGLPQLVGLPIAAAFDAERMLISAIKKPLDRLLPNAAAALRARRDAKRAHG
jgi:hypothetical protein